jgi:alpha-galactosidase
LSGGNKGEHFVKLRRRSFAATISALALATIGVISLQSPASASITAGTYAIWATSTDGDPRCLDVTNNQTGDGVPIQQWDCSLANNQKWNVSAVGGGYYKIVSASSAKCLDVTGGPGATGSGVKIQQWTCNGATNQQWRLDDVTGRLKVIRPRSATNNCLDIEGGPNATQNGARLQQWNCGTPPATNQIFYFS